MNVVVRGDGLIELSVHPEKVFKSFDIGVIFLT